MGKGTVRWGIIGCGDVTEKKSGPGFQKASGSDLVAVMRRNGEKAKDYARRHGVAAWYTDADKLIHHDQVDAVYVATRPDSHFQYAMAALEAGKPVYLEKPMTTSLADSRALVEAAERMQVPLFVAYYRRGIEKYVAVKDMIDRNEIGTVRFVRVLMQQPPMVEAGTDTPPGDGDNGDSRAGLPWRLNPDLSGGGLIMDVGSHCLDLLDYYFGPIGDVSGFSGNQSRLAPVEDTVAGAWTFESGLQGCGIWCFSSWKEEDTIEIHGTAGRISFSVLDVSAPVTVETHRGVETRTFIAPEHVQQPLIQLVVDELRGTGRSPSTGASAVRTERVLDLLRNG
jgi:1,5-anhydro-D-fructose reductase (1,5-anhydro-D-mannitol-forming)